ncbi:MAG: energy-coupling factor transporter ATPase [Monoglobales bacterium]
MIKLENVNYIYERGMPDERQALFDINLEIPDGTVTALIGHTGSGKSTLIQLLNALEKPSSGSINVNGTEVCAKDADIRGLRQRVGLVFQYPEQQLFEETVYKDIAFGPKNMGLSDDEIDKRVREAARLAGVNEKYMNRSPFDLSGGQKRRAAIAGVLAMEPEVLILDEPAAGLDPRGRDGILSEIKKLHEEKPEMIIIFVSHSMEDVAKTAEHIVVMNNGRIAMTGGVKEVFSRGRELEEMGLSVPQITKLCARLSSAGINIEQGIFTVEEAVEKLAAAMNL